jgi:hypothetical protein
VIDFEAHLQATARTVTVLEREGRPARGVTLERTYETTAEDLWDAATNPERLPRWFLPVSGDLRPGGRYELEGNASGTITECIPPRWLSVTWEFGSEVSWVEVRITPEGDARSRLTLCHVCPVDDHYWPAYGPGAAGVGWDLGLIGLDVHLSGSERIDEAELAASAEGRAFIAGLSQDWGRAAVAAGEEPVQAEAAAHRTTAFYTGDEAHEG